MGIEIKSGQHVISIAEKIYWVEETLDSQYVRTVDELGRKTINNRLFLKPYFIQMGDLVELMHIDEELFLEEIGFDRELNEYIFTFLDFYETRHFITRSLLELNFNKFIL